MRLAEFIQHLSDLNALPLHRGRILRAWLNGQALGSGTAKRPVEHFLPRTLRDALPQLSTMLDGLARVHTEDTGSDGTRLLIELADGQMVESVMLPRDGLCVSTQVGCAVGCRFCMTGKTGLLRQVSSLEILAQVVLARRLRTIKKVVFMGMGEPAHNLDNVLEAIDMLGTEGNIGHKNLVFSTVGDPRVFKALPHQRVKPALALSLHTTKATLREQLLPRAPKIAPDALVALGETYARLTDYPIQYQWTLLQGVNDGDDEVEGMIELLKGKYGMLNLIPFNHVDTDEYRRPDPIRIQTIVRRLQRHGVLTKVRNSAGQDVDAGCGQLRARATGEPQTIELRRHRPATASIT